MASLSRRYKLPSRIVDGLLRYKEERIETGKFLRRVLENDLAGTLAMADATWGSDQYNALLYFLYDEMPIESWGSPKAVAAWLGEGVPS